MHLTTRVALVAAALSATLACALPSLPAPPFDHPVSLADLQAAPIALAEAGSGRFEAWARIEGPDGPEEVRSSGAFADGVVAMDIDLRARFARAAERLGQSIPRGFDTEGRIVLDDSTMYVRVPMLHELTGEPGWLSATSNEVGATRTDAFTSSVVDPARLVDTLRVVSQVQEVGHEVVRGVSTAQVAATLPGGRQLEVWLDADHLVRRLRYVIDTSGADVGTVTTTVEIFDHGAPVEIEVPGPGESTPYSGLVRRFLEAGA